MESNKRWPHKVNYSQAIVSEGIKNINGNRKLLQKFLEKLDTHIQKNAVETHISCCTGTTTNACNMRNWVDYSK